MQVKDRMTCNPITVTEDASFEDALHTMKENNIRYRTDTIVFGEKFSRLGTVPAPLSGIEDNLPGRGAMG